MIPIAVPESPLPDGHVREQLRLQLARELHDQVAQSLTTMLVELENFKIEQTGRQSVQREVAFLETTTRQVLTNIRQLLYDLRGEPRLELGFIDTIRDGLVRRFQERTGIKVRVSVSRKFPKQLAADVALNLYRIIQEALNNAWLHGGARVVEVALKVVPGDKLILTITDDGRGISDGSLNQPGMGLVGMKERAVLIGGELTVDNHVGAGTRVVAVFPQERLG